MASQDPIFAQTSALNSRLTALGRALKGNANTNIYAFNRKQATTLGGKSYNVSGEAVFDNPMQAYLAQGVVNQLKQIHAGYKPTKASALSLLVLGHELGHTANAQHGNEHLASRYAVSAWSKLASAFGITNPAKQKRMLQMALGQTPGFEQPSA